MGMPMSPMMQQFSGMGLGQQQTPQEPASEIYFMFWIPTGESVVKALKEFVSQQINHIEEIGFTSDDAKLDDTRKEKLLKAKKVVAILSKDSLKNNAFISGLELLKEHNEDIKLILMHDAGSCYFPNHSEIPESVMSLFAEKATTFLPDYADVVSDGLMESQRKAKSMFMMQKDIFGMMGMMNGQQNDGKGGENLHTNFFLSHKRSSAQGIAGRLYESLKEDYDVFLDSETQFKIHDLEVIVKHTDVFIFILSKDYVESEWCLKELKTAILNKTKIIILRDYAYPTLQPLAAKAEEYLAPVTPDDVLKVIKEAKTFTWIAEYHNACVAKMKKESENFVKKRQNSHMQGIMGGSILKGIMKKY